MRDPSSTIFRRVKFAEVPPDDLVGFVPLDAVGACIPCRDQASLIELKYRIVDYSLDKTPIAPFALKPLLVGFLTFGDVPLLLWQTQSVYRSCHAPHR
jgi:hypothetical protein